jgi:hypothetical protein
MTSECGWRKKPAALALVVFRIMPVAYRMHLGRLVGHTFLLLSHRGRKSGRVYQTRPWAGAQGPRSGGGVV